MKKQSAFLIGLCAFLGSQAAQADEYASKQRSNAAVGHYARARAMLVEALGEFEQARRYARPDMLLDPEEWRLSIISRTEELNRLLDPRPKITREGVRFQANSRLIRRERDRPPALVDGPKASSTYGEEERREEMKASRARLDQIQAEAEERALERQRAERAEEVKADPASVKGKQAVDEAINALSAIPSSETAPKTEKSAAVKQAAPTADEGADDGEAATVVETEEEEVAAAPGAAEESLFGPAKDKEVGKVAAGEQAPEGEKAAGKKISLDSKPVPLTEKQEDQVSKAIDEAIQQRVKTIKENAPKEVTEETEDPE